MTLAARRRAWQIALLSPLLLFALLHLVWRLHPTRDLDVLVVDYTVADPGYREHAVVDEVLDHLRVPYDLGTDHVGTTPGGGPYGAWPTQRPDAIVLADGYGVYVDDAGEIGDFGRTLISPILTTERARDIRRWVETGTPAYGEFAFAPSPTPVLASENVQRAFGVNALGWIATPVDDLSTVGAGIRSLGPDPWPYTGPGVLFTTVHAGSRRPEPQVVVLDRTHLVGHYPALVGRPSGGLGGDSVFARWTELVAPADDADVDVWFEYPLTQAGRARLDEAGIPARWPALVRRGHTRYFAGDGLEDAPGFTLRKFWFGDRISHWLVRDDKARVFHQVLLPALRDIVDLADD